MPQEQSLTASISEVAKLLHPKATITAARVFVRENRIPIAFRSGRGGSWFVPRQAVVDAIARLPDNCHQYVVEHDGECRFQKFETRKHCDAIPIRFPHFKRLAFINLPAIDEIRFAVLTVECLIVVEFQLVIQVIFLQAQRQPDVFVRRQRLARVRFSEKVGLPEIKLFVREQVSEFRKVQKSADARIGWRFCARVMRNDGHRIKCSSDAAVATLPDIPAIEP